MDSREDRIDLRDYYQFGETWLDSIKKKLNSQGKNHLVEKIKSFEDVLVNELFRHAYQNTVQHGSKALESQDYESASVIVKSECFISDGQIIFEITNPQIKAFPASLVGRFYAGSRIEILQSERVGFNGLGQAHWLMVRDLERLPVNTYIEWNADGKNVKLRISINVLD